MKRRILIGSILALLLLASGSRLWLPGPAAFFAPTPARAAFTAELPHLAVDTSFLMLNSRVWEGSATADEARLEALFAAHPRLAVYGRFVEARLAAGRRDTMAAIAAYTEVAAVPDREVALVALEELARLNTRLGRYEEAIDCWHRLAARRGGDAGVLASLEAGRVAVLAGDTAAAVAVCEAVLCEPVAPKLKMLAATELRAILDPRGAEAHRLADLCFSGGDFFAASDLYRRALAGMNPENPAYRDLLYRYARSCERADDFRGAIRAGQELLTRFPGFRTAELRYRIGTCQQRIGADAEAEAQYRAILAESPRSSYTDDILYRLAARRDNAEKRAEALDYYRELLRRHPRSQWADEAAWRIGFACFEEGRFDEAEKAFAAALKRYPRSDYAPAMGYWRGRLLEARRPEEARAQYFAVLRSTADPYYRRLAANAYRRLGGRPAPGALAGIRTRAEQGEERNALCDLRALGDLSSGHAAGRVLGEMQLVLRRVGGWDSVYRFTTDTLDSAALTRDLRRRTPPPVIEEIEELTAIGAYELAAWELKALEIDAGLRPEKRLALARLLAEGGRFRAAIREAEGLVRELGGIQYAPAYPEVVAGLLYPRFYEPIARREAEKYGLDARLVLAVIREESRFEATIVSGAGAHGLMQIMPATGRGVASAMGLASFRVSDLNDERVNIALGTFYLNHLLNRYDNRLHVALAGYNAGPGNVERWLRESATADPELWVEKIPFRETRNYVKKVLGSYWTYCQLDGEPFVEQPLTLAEVD